MKRVLFICCLFLFYFIPLVLSESTEVPKPTINQKNKATNEQIKQEIMSLSLSEAIHLGLSQNMDIKKNILDRAIQKMDIKLAERYLEPEVIINAGYGYSNDSNLDNRGIQLGVRKRLSTAGEVNFEWNQENTLDRNINKDNNSGSINLSLSQPLLRNAGITVGTAEIIIARNTEALNKIQFHQILMEKITAIQVAYWNLFLAYENRISTRRSLDATRDLLSLNESLEKLGKIPPVDLIYSRQEMAAKKVSLLDEEYNIRALNRELVNLLGLEHNIMILPQEKPNFKNAFLSSKEIMAQALIRNPQIKSAEIAVHQRELDLKLAKSAALIDLTLNAGVSTRLMGDSGQQISNSANNSGWNAQLGLSVPLGLPKDRLNHQVIVAENELKKNKMDLEQIKFSVQQMVIDHLNDVNRSLQQITLAKESKDLAQKKVELDQTRLKLGRGTNFQLISSQRDLQGANEAFNRAIVSYLISLAQLDIIIGGTLDTWNIKIE